MSFSKKILKVCKPETATVTLKGYSCELNCSFCKGHYLKTMKTPERILEMDVSSVLLSGPFNADGTISLPDRDLLKSLKEKGISVNLHLGFCNEQTRKELAFLKEHIRAVSFNFMAHPEIIRAIPASFTPDQYTDSYMEYRNAGLNVIPHLLLGLSTLQADLELAQTLSDLNTDKAVLLVKIPEKGEEPIDGDYVCRVIEFLKKNKCRIMIGCMRPGGAWRKKNDPLLIKQGLDMIVNPHPQSLVGIEYEESEQCCALC